MRFLALTAVLLAASALYGCDEFDTTTQPLPPEAAMAAEKGSGGAPFITTALAGGIQHTCALDAGGGAWCWGTNDFGQLGTGGSDDASTPVAVVGGHRFVEVDASGFHTCGLTRAGEAYCWGLNFGGQLGDGTRTDRSEPVAVAGGLRFTDISAGDIHSCGVTEDGTGYCWGIADRQGGSDESAIGTTAPETCQVGNSDVGCATTPVAVDGGLTFSQIDAGLEGSCGLTSSGQVYCWGWNAWWQFGNGSDQPTVSPTLAAGGMVFEDLAYGAVHGCGLTAAGEAYCWGARFFGGLWGSLGTGSFSGSPVPVPVAGGLTFSSLSASRANNVFGFTCGITDSGDAHCWGSNRLGSLGTEDALSTCTQFTQGDFSCSALPVAVAGGITFTAINAGNETATGAARNRFGWGWGSDLLGQLGTDTGLDSCFNAFAGDDVDCALTPVRVAGAARSPRAARTRSGAVTPVIVPEVPGHGGRSLRSTEGGAGPR